MVTPAFRKASSRSRCDSVSKLKSVVSKTAGSGLNVIFVPALFRRAGHIQRAHRRAALEALLVDVAIAPDLELEPFGQRVDDRNTDAVEPARDFVGGVLEFAAGVQHRQHDFRGGLAAFVHVDRNAPAVVDDRDRSVDVNRDFDVLQNPARASSIELSTTSYTRWCRPAGPVDPMYMAGRLRTASNPSRTLILSAP